VTNDGLTAAGLIADILGVLILFSGVRSRGVAGGGAVVVIKSDKDEREERTHRKRERFGLLMVMLGFVLQLMGTLRAMPEEAATELLSTAVFVAILVIYLSD
jgi:hypothetical protein